MLSQHPGNRSLLLLLSTPAPPTPVPSLGRLSESTEGAAGSLRREGRETYLAHILELLLLLHAELAGSLQKVLGPVPGHLLQVTELLVIVPSHLLLLHDLLANCDGFLRETSRMGGVYSL